MSDAVELHEAYERGRAFEREQLAWQRRQEDAATRHGNAVGLFGLAAGLLLIAAAQRGLLERAQAALALASDD